MPHETSDNQPSAHARSLLRHGAAVLIAVLTLAVAAPSIGIETRSLTAGLEPMVSVGDQDSLVFAAPSGKRYSVNAYVSGMGDEAKDIYLVVIRPDGRVFSFAASNQYRLTEGLLPILSGTTEHNFNAATNIPYPLQYTFANDDMAGLYHIYFFVTSAGADPSNANRWITATGRPLIFDGARQP